MATTHYIMSGAGVERFIAAVRDWFGDPVLESGVEAELCRIAEHTTDVERGIIHYPGKLVFVCQPGDRIMETYSDDGDHIGSEIV